MNPSSDRADSVLRQHLRLVRADDKGAESAKGDRLYAVMGPVPLPVSLLSGGRAVFDWTTFSRVDESWLDAQTLESLVLPEDPAKLRVLLNKLSRTKEWPHSILSYGRFGTAHSPLVRLHSNCATGDVFGSRRCECGPQLAGALDQIVKVGCGALVYMADHEGRGIGLFAKAAAYLLQDKGFDTYEANRALGYADDSRDFSDSAFILNHLRGEMSSIRLLSNNPAKKVALSAVDIPVTEMVPHITGINDTNIRYLTSKREHGHILPEDLLKLGRFSSSAEAV